MPIVKGSFRGWGETGSSPSSPPDPVLCPCLRQCQPPLFTQVDTSLPANGEAPHRWERQPFTMFPRSIPGTCPSQFYCTPPLYKVLLMDKYRLCKWVTSQKNPTMGLQPLSRLDSLSCPRSEQRDCWPQWCQRYVLRIIQKDSQGVGFFSNLYGCVVAEDSFILPFPCFLKTCCFFVQELWTLHETLYIIHFFSRNEALCSMRDLNGFGMLKWTLSGQFVCGRRVCGCALHLCWYKVLIPADFWQMSQTFSMKSDCLGNWKYVRKSKNRHIKKKKKS